MDKRHLLCRDHTYNVSSDEKLLLTALFFSFVCILTSWRSYNMPRDSVGYGDICPGDISGPGRTFIVLLAFSGLGMFCGPIMDLASSWKDNIPFGGTVALLSSTMVTAVFIFSYLLQEMSESEAAYFSIITGMELLIQLFDRFGIRILFSVCPSYLLIWLRRYNHWVRWYQPQNGFREACSCFICHSCC